METKREKKEVLGVLSKQKQSRKEKNPISITWKYFIQTHGHVQIDPAAGSASPSPFGVDWTQWDSIQVLQSVLLAPIAGAGP